MVVVIDETPYANVELVLMHYFDTVLDAYLDSFTDTAVPPDGKTAIQVNRMPGEPDDGLTDYPRIRVISYADDYTEAQRLAERIRQKVARLDNGGVVTMPPDADVDLADKVVQFDTARGDVPPENEAYPNPERVQVVAYYQFSLRRPR